MNRVVTHEFPAWAQPEETIAAGTVLYCRPLPASSDGKPLFECGADGKSYLINEYSLTTFTKTVVP